MTQDLFSVTLQRYQHQLAELRRQVAAVEAKIGTLEEVRRDVATNGDKSGHSGGSFVGIPQRMTDACVWVVDKYGVDRKLRTGDLKQRLREHGFKSGSSEKNFPIHLFRTLMRLIESKRIAGEKKDGAWEFWSKQTMLL